MFGFRLSAKPTHSVTVIVSIKASQEQVWWEDLGPGGDAHESRADSIRARIPGHYYSSVANQSFGGWLSSEHYKTREIWIGNNEMKMVKWRDDEYLWDSVRGVLHGAPYPTQATYNRDEARYEISLDFDASNWNVYKLI